MKSVMGFALAAASVIGVDIAPAPAAPAKPRKASRATPGGKPAIMAIYFKSPARATFISPEPMTKRRKRRLRGRAKAARAAFA